MLFIYFSLIVMANNIFGQYYINYIDLGSSLNTGLLLSIGSFSGSLDGSSSKTEYIMLFFLGFLVIYFLLNVISGAFIDIYRITVLKKGYPYFNKNIDIFEDKKIKIKIEK